MAKNSIVLWKDIHEIAHQVCKQASGAFGHRYYS